MLMYLTKTFFIDWQICQIVFAGGLTGVKIIFS